MPQLAGETLRMQSNNDCYARNEPENTSIDVSTIKLPLLAMGLVNSALAMLLNEIAVRFFELAFSENYSNQAGQVSGEAEQTTHQRKEDPNITANNTCANDLEGENPVEAQSELDRSPEIPVTIKPEYEEDNLRQLTPCTTGQSSQSLDTGFVNLPETTTQPIPDFSRVTTLTYLKRYSCNVRGCGKVFFSRCSLSHHRQTHLAIREFPCIQPGCNLSFSTQPALCEHLLLHQSAFSNSPCKCSYPGCDKIFYGHDRLVEHFRIHTGERPYVCDYPGCSYRFARRSNLFAHKRVHIDKNQRRQYHCTQPGCGKTFLYTRSLTEHMNIHIGERPYRCEFPGCDKSFTSKSYLHAHRRIHLNPNNNMAANFDTSISYSVTPFPVTVTVPVPGCQEQNLLPYNQTSQPANTQLYSFYPTQQP